MKVGILTFNEADNFGAVLQAYALKETLYALGAAPEFVTIQSKALHTHNNKQNPLQPLAPLVKKMLKAAECRAQLFKDFRTCYLNSSRPYAVNETDALDQCYDVFIAGSDQIWNFNVPNVDARYFLPFAKTSKRCSYAASFGANSVPLKAKSWCAGQLKSFKHISVREESGKQIVKQLTGRKAEVSLDPTLLLDKERWEQLVKPVHGNYLLLFMTSYDAALFARAKKHAAARGLELKTVSAAFMPQIGFKGWSDIGVSDWVSLIYYADCIVTNSFHGTAFAILFNKEFSVGSLAGELGARNGRLRELLVKAGLLNLLNGEPGQGNRNTVESWLTEARQQSFEYLKKVISND